MVVDSILDFLRAELRILFTVTALCIFFPTASHAEDLVWIGDFETGDFSQFRDHLYGEGTRSSKRLVTSPVRDGRYAVELEILDVDSDATTERAELMSLLENNQGTIHFEWDGPEYWIGFSFLFKEEIAKSFTFFQIHAPNEPKGDPCDFAGNTFSIWGANADLNGGFARDLVVRVIEDGGISAGKGAASNNTVVHRYPFPIGEWQDYVVNFRLSTRGDGFYKVWKNGELIYSKSGLTNVNYRDSCGNLIPEDRRHHNGAHIGVYAPGVSGYRRIFYDEVRVVTGPDAYSLVAPEGQGKSFASSTPKPPIVAKD